MDPQHCSGNLFMQREKTLEPVNDWYANTKLGTYKERIDGALMPQKSKKGAASPAPGLTITAIEAIIGILRRTFAKHNLF